MKQLITFLFLFPPFFAFADECIHPNKQPYKEHWCHSRETVCLAESLTPALGFPQICRYPFIEDCRKFITDPFPWRPFPGRLTGLDYLGLLNSNVNASEVASKIPTNSAIGILDTTFGSISSNLETVLKTGKIKLVRIQLLNAVCARNNRCTNGDSILKGHTSASLNSYLESSNPVFVSHVTQRTSYWKAVASRFPSVKFYLSPLLEHDQSELAFRNITDWIKAEWPQVQIVNNPHTGWSGPYRGSILERHGTTPVSSVSSLDGKDIFSLSTTERNAWRARTANEIFTLSWCVQANCLPDHGHFTPPETRTNCAKGSRLTDWINKTKS